jgi:uncharacterized membrane protein YfcA
VAAVVAFASAVQLATGFGFALVCVPLLILFVDPHLAVLIALQIGLIGALYQAVEGRREINRRVVGRITVAAFVGLPVGGWVYARSSPDVLKVLIGVIIVTAVMFLARGLSIRRSSPIVDLTAGLLTGFLTTSTGTSGPPIVTVLHARNVSPPVFRATTSTIFSVLDGVAIIGYVVTGRFPLWLFLATLATLPGLVLGAWVGIAARRRLSREGFRLALLVLVAEPGLSDVVTAFL